MKKVNGFVWAMTVALFAGTIGCSQHDGNSSNQLAIPDHLNFVPQKGPTLTDDDYKNFQAIAKATSLGSPSDYLLKFDDYKKQQRINDQRAKLPPAYAQVLKDMSAKCTVTNPTETTVAAIDLDKGQNHGQKVTASSVSGDDCAEVFSERVQDDFFIIDYNHSSEAPVGTYRQVKTDTQSESIKDVSVQKLVNFVSTNFVTSSEMTGHVDDKKVSLYGKIKFTGEANFADGTPTIGVQGTGEVLFHDKNQEVVLHFQISGYSKPVLLSISSKSVGDDKVKMIFYVNGDQISSDNMKALISATGKPLDSGTSLQDDGTILTDASKTSY